MLVSKDVTSINVIVKIDVDIIKQPDNYTYLGQTITSNGKCDDEFVKIIEIARGAFNSILKTLTARHINMKTRKRIIKAYVDPSCLRDRIFACFRRSLLMLYTANSQVREVLLCPRHTGGAVPLRFLLKTAITAVTPPVVFHSFSPTRHTCLPQ